MKLHELKFSNNFCHVMRAKMRNFFTILQQLMKYRCFTMKPKPNQSMEYHHKSSYKKKKKFKPPGLGRRSHGYSFLGCRWCYPHESPQTWDHHLVKAIHCLTLKTLKQQLRSVQKHKNVLLQHKGRSSWTAV